MRTSASLAVLLAIGFVSGSRAQVITDGSLGPALEVPGPDRRITEALGRRVDGVLFHSFEQFDIPEDESATFEGSPTLNLIVGRVTGGAPTSIEGLLASEAPNADLVLLNPSGVVFGSEAELDLPGSLHVGTADYLAFENGARFEARAGGAVPLTVDAPAAFGFLDPGPGPALAERQIVIDRAALELGDGATLTLAAGSIRITAGDDPAIRIKDGQVRLVAVSGAGEVALDGAPSAPAAGPVVLVGRVDDAPPDDDDDDDDGDPDDAAAPSIDLSGPDGGFLFVGAGTLEAMDFAVLSTSTGTSGVPRFSIDIAASGVVSLGGASVIASTAEGAGRAGDVRLSAATVQLADEAQILSDVTGAGQGGAVLIEAGDVILSGDAEIAADVDEGADGRGGLTRIVANRIVIGGDAEISSDTGGAGPGGSVELLVADRLEIRDAGGVFTDGSGAGPAGDITVAGGVIALRGGSIAASAAGDGGGGDIWLSGGFVTLTDGALVTARSDGAGAAGDVRIDSTGDLSLTGARVETASAAASGGRIDLRVGGTLLLRNAAVESSVASGVGDGGDIAATARFLVMDDGRIAANAFGGTGGDVSVRAEALFLDQRSSITATSVLSVDGAVVVDAPETDLSGTLAPLSVSLTDVEALLPDSCGARAPGGSGSFTIAGAEALPASPFSGFAFGFHDAPPSVLGGWFGVSPCAGGGAR